ncbi:RNA-directed DNA polymerase, eukaryota, reverse transcriptase zinc-binding domain protein [Tanacetum coccineum]
MSTNNRSSRRQVKLPMKFSDHVMANSSQRDVLNRSKEMNLNSNGNRNEMNVEEQNVMKSSQETPIKSHADENAEMSNRDSGNPKVEVKSNFADKCNSSMNCDNDKGDETDTESIKITSSMSYASMVKNDDIPQNLDYIPTVINEEGIEVVIFDDALVKKGSERWGLTLCGQFVRYGMHINELRYNLRRMWSKFGVTDIDVCKGGKYMFKFKNEECMNTVLEKGQCALASSLGRPILMDSMTTMMCHKGVGNLGFARVLVEMEAIKELKMEIETQYMDKEKNIKGSKKVQVKYDWKPPVCTHCKVFGHESKHCNKGSNADKGKLDYDDYNHSKERNNMEGNPLNARSIANNVRQNNRLKNGGVNRIHNNKPRKEYRKKQGETEKLEKEKESNGATKNKWNVNGKVVKDLRNTANKYSILESLPKDNDQELQMLKEKMIVDKFLVKKIQPTVMEAMYWTKDMVKYFKEKWADDSVNSKDVCCDQDEIAKVMEENVINGIEGRVLNQESEQIQVCAVLETRLKNKKLHSTCDNLFNGWSWVSNMKECDKGCRIVVGCDNSDTCVQVINMTSQYLFCVISSARYQYKCFYTFVYAANDGIGRRRLWNELIKERSYVNGKPWCLAGDWNVTLYPNEHSCGASNLHKTGAGNMTGILKKLDRVMINEDFIKQYPQGHTKFLLMDKEVGLVADFYEAEKDEEKFLYQQTRIKWLNEGDKNSSYFHKVLKERSNKSKVFSLYDDAGVIHKGDQGIFENGRMLGQLNAIIVSLIPKIQTPSKVTDFRPITYCNVLYKCTNKVLTNRTKPVLRELVSCNHSAFIPGRNIQDNILITQELMRGYNKKTGPKRMAFKIDLQKAYDTISWDFLKSTLEGFGFYERMIQWITECVTTAAFTLNVNGERVGQIAKEPKFQYHFGCKEILLTHVCFADDLLVMCHGDKVYVEVIKKALQEFSSCSGLLPNNAKSSVFFGSLKEVDKNSIISVLPFSIGKFPVKYLGVSLIAKILGIKECGCLLDKIKFKKDTLWVKWIHSVKLRGKSIFEISADISDIDWHIKFPHIVNIKVPMIRDGEIDKIVWKTISGKSVSLSILSFYDWLSKESEDLQHLFFQCPFSKNVWSQAKKMADIIGNEFDWDGIVQTLNSVGNGNNINSVVRRFIFATGVYNIWQERNKMIFKNVMSSSEEVYKQIIEIAINKLLGIKVKNSSAVRIVESRWSISLNKV